jgi:hypothetical protein
MGAGVFGSSSESKTDSSPQTGTDEALLLRGQGNVAGKGKNTVGARGKVFEGGGGDFSKAKISSTTNVSTKGLDFSGLGSGNNITVGGDTSDLTKSFLETINSISASGAAATQAAVAGAADSAGAASAGSGANSLTSMVNDALNNAAGNADKSQKPGGKTWLWIGGGVLLVGAILFFILRRGR